MANPSLRKALTEKRFILAPGVFDMISAKIADGMGFDCIYGTGFGAVASALGVADAGIATYADMVTRMGTMARGCKTPLVADADTGYGGLLNVRHTTLGYEAAGMTGIQLEDQEMPKKCGHTPGRRVIPAEEMVLKIKVAAEARRDPNFLIVARTDSRTTLGLEEAIRRGRLYGDAGADIVFIESPESEDEMRAIGKAISKPLLANMVEGGRTPILPAARLQEIGYAMAIYPAIGFLAAAAALERAYAHLKNAGDSIALGESYGFKKMTELMGFPDVWDFEKKWAQPEKDTAA
ncbi:MAG: isocitrate lyase/PEP mutase family protein [Roseomonas sp.]|nr:isocitrate lyase/PEP mutase family protein [Roseomonas sp.]MCA3327558.1 isocitrate lyase/PEP mutase family protein [Roseomonas sp.]MCA3329811.1 isocitrate lyase/PEP mutase family protein [Roseomonas sp.]MCA3336262.1 isocitrate lyase/PEP mutase family protein [Roseomonas sp.]MCA3345207.1 isocitrate lyase/PEP mutase family protein [Roseomonas sp.]